MTSTSESDVESKDIFSTEKWNGTELNWKSAALVSDVENVSASNQNNYR